jgi:hypothetical protein
MVIYTLNSEMTAVDERFLTVISISSFHRQAGELSAAKRNILRRTQVTLL